MSPETLNLDDRRFADLLAEAYALIPEHAPEWTNHNASDPGITLVELLAYFTELTLYRANQVPAASRLRFVELIAGPEAAGGNGTAPEQRFREAVERSARPNRIITARDCEQVALSVAASHAPGAVRVRCLPRRNLADRAVERRGVEQPGHMSLVVAVDDRRADAASLLAELRASVQERRLLGTRVHVVPPGSVHAALRASIVPDRTADAPATLARARSALETHFSPFDGEEGSGRSFGRDLRLSEVYDTLDRVAGVDFITDVHLVRLASTAEALEESSSRVGVQLGRSSTVAIDARLGSSLGAGRLHQDASGRLSGVRLEAHELLRLHADVTAGGAA